ncbi:MAG: hypothetical protein ACKO1L_13190, partial [Brachymonas sp.]
PADSQFSLIKSSFEEEFSPISDMRASAAYRRILLGSLVERFASELRGEGLTNLQDWAELEEVLA